MNRLLRLQIMIPELFLYNETHQGLNNQNVHAVGAYFDQHDPEGLQQVVPLLNEAAANQDVVVIDSMASLVDLYTMDSRGLHEICDLATPFFQLLAHPRISMEVKLLINRLKGVLLTRDAAILQLIIQVYENIAEVSLHSHSFSNRLIFRAIKRLRKPTSE